MFAQTEYLIDLAIYPPLFCFGWLVGLGFRHRIILCSFGLYPPSAGIIDTLFFKSLT